MPAKGNSDPRGICLNPLMIFRRSAAFGCAGQLKNGKDRQIQSGKSDTAQTVATRKRYAHLLAHKQLEQRNTGGAASAGDDAKANGTSRTTASAAVTTSLPHWMATRRPRSAWPSR